MIVKYREEEGDWWYFQGEKDIQLVLRGEWSVVKIPQTRYIYVIVVK